MSNDPAYGEYINRRRNHWNQVALKHPEGARAGRYYHQRMESVYGFCIAPGLSVLEVGCGRGDLLSSLSPKRGVGVDLSPEMIAVAKRHYPDLEFVEADIFGYRTDERFDVIIMSDLVNDLFDVQSALVRAREFCKPDGRIILNFFSHLWEKPLEIARATGLASQLAEQNWLAPDDVKNMLHLTDWDVIRHFEDFLMPFNIPLLAPMCNRVLAKIWPMRSFCLTNFIVARPCVKAPPMDPTAKPSVSVIIPARNEEGNVPSFFTRTPKMGSHTELIIVEGNSTDDTYAAIERELPRHPEWDAKLFKQAGKGKADAVRVGFDKAKGDVLMILDADLTVVPEDLPRFYNALVDGHGEFINGVRLVYPMEGKAMRFLNLLGNKFFSFAFSWILGQPIKDTLCGTKVLYKKNYEKIVAGRSYFGDFDPFGDYDLIFGAAKIGLKIVDMPIRYRDRTYGSSNIQRWRHGLLLLRMVSFAARRLKFV